MADVKYAGFNEEVEQISDGKSILDGFSESTIVEVFNPLTIPFRAKFARSLPQQAQLSEQDRRVAEIGGIDVRKQGPAEAHAVSYVVLEPGQTKKLPGNVAQNVVRQMTTYIIQQRGKSGLVADANLRRQVEEELVVNFRSMIQNQTLTPEEQFQRQLDELNNPESATSINTMLDEVAFPTELERTNESTTAVSETTPGNTGQFTEADSGSDSGTGTAKRSVGRPKKETQLSS